MPCTRGVAPEVVAEHALRQREREARATAPGTCCMGVAAGLGSVGRVRMGSRCAWVPVSGE